jgi:FdrA protein
MSTHVDLRPGAYADSVTLLQVSREVQGVPGVAAAQVAMATPLNLDVLQQMGFPVPVSSPNDMVVAVRLEQDAPAGCLEAAVAVVDAALSRRTDGGGGSQAVAPHRTTAAALREVTGGAASDTLVLVSVPGASALVEAVDALESGHDVMVFSDNVPLEQEVALKRLAGGLGRLVMGPDCGTAVVDGLGLGFANATRPGPVGVVAASGTGCQQLLALLDHAEVGISSALGVGGRDLSAAVGGLSTREALRRLDEDPVTELVVVVSKPPDPEVETEIRAYAASLSTPVLLALLGPGQPDLTEAAEQVLSALGRPVPDWPVASSRPLPRSGGHLLRGLFVGGTLCDEAMLVATAALGPVHSNIPLSPELGVGADLDADTHVMLDFGDDALTGGRAHPMIDPTLRLDHLARVLADPRTGVVLLDVVLGHGVEPDPAARLAPALERAAARGVPVVVSCVGSAGDPQGLPAQVAALTAAGAEVHLSNARAARRAVELLGDPA